MKESIETLRAKLKDERKNCVRLYAEKESERNLRLSLQRKLAEVRRLASEEIR